MGMTTPRARTLVLTDTSALPFTDALAEYDGSEASPNPQPIAKRAGQIGFNGTDDAGQGYATYLYLNRMKSSGYNGQWNNDSTLSQYGYPQSPGTMGRDTATFVSLRRPLTGTIRYVLRHNGTNLQWHWQGSGFTIVDSSNPNRVIFDVGPGVDGENVLVLDSATVWPDYKPNNPIETRDGFAVYELALESLYLSGRLLYPQASDSISMYWVYRFMEFMKTNNSLVRTLADRTPVGNCTYSHGAPWGMPLEVAIEIINYCNVPFIWVNVPYGANEEYTRWFFQTLHDRLKPSIRIKVEKSNEPWNFGNGFEQGFAYFEDVGHNLTPPGGNPEGYGYSATLMARIGREIFADQPHRLFTTLNLQANSLDNYERVALGVSIAGEKIGRFFNSVAVAMYTSGGAQDLAQFDQDGGSNAKRQLLLDELAIFEASGPDFASRSVRQELIDQMRHGNVIPGWPDAITLDGVRRQCAGLRAFCVKHGIRHGVIYEMQDFHTYMEVFGSDLGTRINLMFTSMQNDVRVSGKQAGSYERDRFTYMRENGVSGYAVLTDVGPNSQFGAWRTKDTFFSPNTRLWEFYEWYNLNATDDVLFEIHVKGNPNTNIGRAFNLSVTTYGGHFPTKTPYPTIKSGNLPAGLTYVDGNVTGTVAGVKGTYNITFASRDDADNEITQTVAINVADAAIGRRYFRFRPAAGGLPSLTATDFMMDAARYDMNGWLMSGDQINSAENVYNLIDGDDSTIWTGQPDIANAVVFDTGVGNAAQPTTIRMRNRPDIPSRAPVNFVWEWSNDGINWVVICTVTNAAYVNNVYVATMTY